MEKVISENFQSLKDSEKLTVIKVGAEWCGPCRMVAPVLERVSKSESHEDVYFGEVDADESRDLAMQLGVRSIPTTIFFKNGQEVKRFTGAFTDEQLNEMVEETKKMNV